MEDIKRMELEYKEVYDELFERQDTLLERTLEQKRFALRELAKTDESPSKMANMQKMKTLRKQRRAEKRRKK